MKARRASPLPDLITALFLLVTVAVITLVVILLANPRSSLNPYPQPTNPFVAIAPTDSPTLTPSPTPTALPPSPTPLPPPPTATALPSATFTPSKVPPPSATPVLGQRASATPIRTGSASASATPIAAPPTATASGFQFVARPINYDSNKTSEGCKWNSVAGTVIDLDAKPVKGVAISIQGGNGLIDETIYSGQERRFGEGGFEVFLGSQPREDDYTLLVLSKTGSPLSEPLKVRTRATCIENVTIITFVQTR